MTSSFPNSPQLHTNYCFLSPLEEQQRLLVDLNSSLIFHRLPDVQLPDPEDLRADLVGRYGGHNQNWRLSAVQGGYLVRIPEWVPHDDVLLDSYWEEEKGLYVGPWQTVDASSELPLGTRVILTIRDFPLDFWHPYYFRQALASMGVLVGFSDDRRRQFQDKKTLKLLMDCYDTSLIPFKLYIGHAGRWSECKVELDGRDYLGDSGPTPPPPSPGAPRARVLIPPMNLQLMYQLYQPRWRIQGLALPHPFPDRQRGSAPAARLPRLITRPIDYYCEPSPGDILMVNKQKQRNVTAHWPQIWKYHEYSNATRPQCNYHLQDHAKESKRYQSNFEALAELKTKIPPHISITHNQIYLLLPFQPPFYTLSHQYLFTYTTEIILPNHKITKQNQLTTKKSHMATMSTEDEALIARFVGLSTEEGAVQAISLPQSATSSTDWAKCLLMKVVTDKTVLDDSFIGAMSRAWATGPNVEMEQITKNCYLAKFQDDKDLQRVVLGGPWTFRGDMVAMARVQSHQDLRPENVTHMDAWVQFFNIPHNSLTEEGLLIMASEVGAPISGPVHGFVSGRAFVKIKLRLEIQAVCKDKVKFKHPDLGEVTVHCTYEKIGRICRFCGQVGHDMALCADHMKLNILLQDPGRKGKYKVSEVLAPNKGAWITNAGLIPYLSHTTSQPGPKPTNKRQYRASTEYDYQNTEAPLVIAEGSHNLNPGSKSPPGISPKEIPLVKRPRPARPISPANHI